MRALATMILRLLALVGKELVEVIRRPGALVSLVLGPFLIMAVFGLGYNGERRPLETVVVIPAGFGPADRRRDLPGPRRWRAAHPGGRPMTRRRPRPGLVDGSADVVVVAPPDAEAQFRAGKQSIIGVRVNTVDPLRANYAGFLAANLANAVNQTIIRRAVEETEGYIAAVRPQRGRSSRPRSSPPRRRPRSRTPPRPSRRSSPTSGRPSWR